MRCRNISVLAALYNNMVASTIDFEAEIHAEFIPLLVAWAQAPAPGAFAGMYPFPGRILACLVPLKGSGPRL